MCAPAQLLEIQTEPIPVIGWIFDWHRCSVASSRGCSEDVTFVHQLDAQVLEDIELRENLIRAKPCRVIIDSRRDD